MSIVGISLTKVGIELHVPVDMSDTVPSFCVKQRRGFYYACSLRYLPEILSLYRNINSLDEIDKNNTFVYRVYEREMRRRALSNEIKNAEELPEHNYSGLWKHQARGALLAEVNSRYAFFFDTRTGKTRMAYSIITKAIEDGRVNKAIVFVPSSIIPDWLSDAQYFSKLRVVAYYKDAKTKTEALASNFNVLLFSIEQTVNNADIIEGLHFNMAFFDESSKLKSPRSQISQYTRKFSTTVEYFYLLSATPAPNGYHEYYTQMMCLDPYIFPGARTHFVNKYFNNISRNPNFEKLIIKPEKKDEFMQLIEDYALYVDQQVMPTAGKVFKEVKYALPNDAKAIYEDMLKNMRAVVEDTELTVDMAAVMRSKLQQIVSGFLIDTEKRKQNAAARFLGQPTQEDDILKIDAARNARLHVLMDIIKKYYAENKNEQFVIWANYQQEFLDIRTALGTLYNVNEIATLSGATNTAYKEEAVSKFKAHEIKVLICHPASVGMGKNFTEAHVAIYYSLNDSWELFKQSCERIAGHIAVQPKQCEYYIILAENTINELVYSNIKNKRNQSYNMLKFLQSGGEVNID